MEGSIGASAPWLSRTGAGQVQHDPALQRDDAGADLDQAQAQGVELRHPPGGALRHEAAQGPEQPVGAGVQHEAELVGAGLATGGSVSGEVQAPSFDVVLGLAALAIEVLVDPSCRAAGEVGDDEAGVGALGAGLDAGDDPLDPAPAPGAVVELLVAAQLIGPGYGGAPGSGALLQRLDVPAQGAGRGDAEHEVEALGAAEVQHLGGAVMAVGPDQDLDPRPVAADPAHEAAQEGAGLGAAGPASGAQHGGHRPALAIEDHDGLEAVLVVVGVEAPQLLLAVDGVESVVQVQHDPTRHPAEAGAVQPDHGPCHAQQGAQVGQVLKPRDGRLRADTGAT